jgi:hypothetical protein
MKHCPNSPCKSNAGLKHSLWTPEPVIRRGAQELFGHLIITGLFIVGVLLAFPLAIVTTSTGCGPTSPANYDKWHRREF